MDTLFYRGDVRSIPHHPEEGFTARLDGAHQKAFIEKKSCIEEQQSLTVLAQNLALHDYDKPPAARFGWLYPKRLIERARGLLREFDVRGGGPEPYMAW
jgi:hypothetical protein